MRLIPTILFAFVTSVSTPAVADTPLSPREASQKIGEFCSVLVDVQGIADRGGTLMMHGADAVFFIVIPDSARPQFDAAGINDPKTYFSKKRVQVTGIVKKYPLKHRTNGWVLELPSIEVTQPDQLKIVDTENK
jgi:hypothetical protein